MKAPTNKDSTDELTRAEFYELATPLTNYFKEQGISDINAGMLAANLVELQSKAYAKLLQAHYARQEAEIVAKYVTDVWGERCEIKDVDDFHDDDLTNSRCGVCLQWEIYDEWLTQQAELQGREQQ